MNFGDISKFRMNKDALQDNEEIKLIYTSQSPDSNNELKYYIHLIAVSQKTGDTVNILTTADNGLSMNDKDKIFNYFNQDNVAFKLSQIDLENLKDIDHVDDISKIEANKIDKVARDPKFDNIADNNYPTVIGIIGTFSQNEK
jgi:hypothetical protein